MVPQNPCLLVLRSCVTLTPWALLGPSDSLTQNRIQQTGWGVTPKVGLPKDWDFSLVCYLLLSVGAFSPEETSHHEWAALWSPRPGVDGSAQQPMRNWDPSVVIETAWNGSSPVEPPDDSSPSWCPDFSLWQTLSQRYPAECHPNSWPRETEIISLCCFKLPNVETVWYISMDNRYTHQFHWSYYTLHDRTIDVFRVLVSLSLKWEQSPR